MKPALAVLVVLLGAAVPTLQGAPQDSRFIVRMEAPPGRESIESDFTITNQSHERITAVLIACDGRPFGNETSVPEYVFELSDSAIDDTAEIPYHGSATFRVEEPDYVSMSCTQESSVRAVLFGDGSSYGDNDWVKQILDMRQYTWQQVEGLISLLQSAKKSGTTKAQLKAQLAAIAKPYPLNRSGSILRATGPLSWIDFDVSRNLARDQEYSDNAPVSQALADDLLEPVVDLRQRLLYSKPTFPGLPQVFDPNGAPSPDFTINFPGGLGSSDMSIGNTISVYYTLSAKGEQDKSLFDRFFPEKEPETFRIHTLVAGHSASSLQVAIYVAGCQIKIVKVLDLSKYSGNESFECVKLPKITFTGQVLSSDLLDGKQYAIQIQLHNSGEDGTPWFDIALADGIKPDEKGVFEVEIPDFSYDPISTSGGAVLQFFAGRLPGRFPVSVGTLAKLAPANGTTDSDGDLHPVSGYGVVTFNARPYDDRSK